MSFRPLGLCLFALTACVAEAETSTPAPLANYATLPATPAPEAGRLVVMPKHVVKAHTDTLTCWVPDWVPDRDYLVTRFDGLQGQWGHHLVALRTDGGYKPGSKWDCTDLAQMTNLSPLVLPELANQPLLPPGFAVRLPKGTKIVMQSHYLNNTDQDMEVRDVGAFQFAPVEAKPTEVSYLIINDGLIKLPMGETTTRTSTCTLPSDVSVLSAMGHMHEWGKAIHVDLARAGTTTAPERVYDVPKWQASYRDLAPINNFGVAKSLGLKAGDKLSLSCSWLNDSDHVLKFPHEMCVSVMYYYPATPKGLILCENE
jgi:hypothetical protein